MIRDVTDLDVYQEALNLLPELYKLMNKLPRNESDLSGQTKRAAKSIAANIAEGFAKRYFEKEFKRYLLNAIGSSDEVISHLRKLQIVLPDLHSDSEILFDQYKILSKRLTKLYKIWSYKPQT